MIKITAINDVYYPFEGGIRNVFPKRIKQIPALLPKQGGVDELVLSRRAEQMKEARKSPVYIQHEGGIEAIEV